MLLFSLNYFDELDQFDHQKEKKYVEEKFNKGVSNKVLDESAFFGRCWIVGMRIQCHQKIRA